MPKQPTIRASSCLAVARSLVAACQQLPADLVRCGRLTSCAREVQLQSVSLTAGRGATDRGGPSFEQGVGPSSFS